MLKFTYTIGLGLTAAAALPAALSPQSLQGGTEAALNNSVKAIDELRFISDAIQRREAGSIQRVLDATTPPLAPAPQQDAFLTQLRQEIGELRLSISQARAHKASMMDGMMSAGQGGEMGKGGDAMMDSKPGSPGGSLDLKPSIEGEGFNADMVRQGRLLFRADRFQEAIEVLSRLTDSSEAEYWAARSFEALGNEREATLRYRRLIDGAEPDDYIARRAEHDLSFLEWKQRFNGQRNK